MSKRPHKYRAVRTTLDGITFHSKKEAARYAQLKMLEKAGKIQGLCLQPEYVLYAGDGDTKLGVYRADFEYAENGQHIVEDVKGFKTPLYRWKKKHVEAQYGIQVRET
jgi:dsDNA-binding SOS-regulon protein